jgi:hypothetical protein
VSDDHALVRRHFEAMIGEAKAQSIPADVIGRLALQEVVALWMRSRPWRDVASELEFTARSLDPDADFEFMRP